MPIDLSTLFQPTPYPVNPIAQFLQIAYQSRESRRRRTEDEAEKKRRDELYQLQLGGARREAQRDEEQARVDAMPAGQFAAAQGLRVTPGLETKTIGELRRAQLLATAFERVDPRAEAQQRISGSEMLAKTFGIPSPVYGEDIRAATGYQGPLPDVPARPSLAPAPGQGIASTPLEEGVMLGAREERMVEVPGLGRMPVSEAVKIVGTEGLRRITGIEPAPEKPETIPVMINGRTYNVTEAQAAQLAVQLQRDRPGQMVTVKDPVSGQTVTIPATSLPSFFPRRAPGTSGAMDLVTALELRDRQAEQRAARERLAQAREDLATATGKVRSLQKGGAKAGITGPTLQNPTAPAPTAADKALDAALADQAAAEDRIRVAEARLGAAAPTRPAAPSGAGGAVRVTVPGRPQPPTTKTVTRAQLKAYADAYFKGDLNAAQRRVKADGFTVVP